MTNIHEQNAEALKNAAKALIEGSAHTNFLYKPDSLTAIPERMSLHMYNVVSGEVNNTELTKDDGSTIIIDKNIVENMMSRALVAALPEAKWEYWAGKGPSVKLSQELGNLEITDDVQKAFDGTIEDFLTVLRTGKRTPQDTKTVIESVANGSSETALSITIRPNPKIEGTTITCSHSSEKTAAKNNSLATTDAAKIGKALQTLFPNASTQTDIRTKNKHINISPDIMAQIEAKAEAGTLADEFSAAMAQVQANAQRGGGRG